MDDCAIYIYDGIGSFYVSCLRQCNTQKRQSFRIPVIIGDELSSKVHGELISASYLRFRGRSNFTNGSNSLTRF
jgi:hypothetical protein